jgi:hypothetical protein
MVRQVCTSSDPWLDFRCTKRRWCVSHARAIDFCAASAFLRLEAFDASGGEGKLRYRLKLPKLFRSVSSRHLTTSIRTSICCLSTHFSSQQSDPTIKVPLSAFTYLCSSNSAPRCLGDHRADFQSIEPATRTRPQGAKDPPSDGPPSSEERKT